MLKAKLLTTYTPSSVPKTPSNFLPRVTSVVNCLRTALSWPSRSFTVTQRTGNGRPSCAEVR